MNTIPLIFNQHQIARTVLGGKDNPDAKMNISVIMLNSSGSHLRVQALENLLGCGFRSIVWIEPARDNYNLEDLSRRYENVKFVIPLDNATDGELINICMDEVSRESEYVLVLRDLLRIPTGILLQNLAENITRDKPYCVVPRLLDESGEGVSVNILPEAHKGRFVLKPSQLIGDGLPTIYPYNYIALYNREKFIQLGGFDYTITSPYWQNADLGLRSWLWGEETRLSTALQLSYETELPVDDTTRDISYLRFYLKNIVPKFREDHGIIKNISFINFLFSSKCGFFEAVTQFREARNWVMANKYRFKCDIHYIIENWANKK